MRVVVAEDSVLLREGLVRLLDDGGIETVAAVGDAEALLAAIVEHRPDLAIVDVRMPPTYTDEGLWAALQARTRVPEVAIVVLSQYVEERYATDLIGESSRGVGYLLKERVADMSDFLAAVHQVAGGGTIVDAEVVTQLLGRRRGGPLDALSDRERGVLALMAEGRSNAAIARHLGVVDGTVEKHTASIFAKLGLESTEETHRRVLAVLAYLDPPR